MNSERYKKVETIKSMQIKKTAHGHLRHGFTEVRFI